MQSTTLKIALDSVNLQENYFNERNIAKMQNTFNDFLAQEATTDLKVGFVKISSLRILVLLAIEMARL